MNLFFLPQECGVDPCEHAVIFPTPGKSQIKFQTCAKIKYSNAMKVWYSKTIKSDKYWPAFEQINIALNGWNLPFKMLIITPLPSSLHCYITQHFHTLKVQIVSIVQIAVGDCKRYKVSVLSRAFWFLLLLLGCCVSDCTTTVNVLRWH